MRGGQRYALKTLSKGYIVAQARRSDVQRESRHRDIMQFYFFTKHEVPEAQSCKGSQRLVNGERC